MLHPVKIWVCSHTRCRWVECAMIHNFSQYEWAKVHKVYGHKHMQAAFWSFPHRNLLLHWRNSFTQGFCTYYLLSCKLSPDSPLLWLRLAGKPNGCWRERIYTGNLKTQDCTLNGPKFMQAIFASWTRANATGNDMNFELFGPRTHTDLWQWQIQNVLFLLIHLFLSVMTKYISSIYKIIYVYLSTHTKLWSV